MSYFELVFEIECWFNNLCFSTNKSKTCLILNLAFSQNSDPDNYFFFCRVTDVFWPAKVGQQKIVLFKLNFWDSGESATKKYSHINPVSNIVLC